MKKILILLVMFIPSLRVTCFAQEPIAVFEILSYFLQDQEGKPVKIIDNDYSILLKGQSYQVKVTLKNISGKKYNDSVRLDVSDLGDVERRIEVLDEKHIIANKNQVVDLVFKFKYDDIKVMKDPIVYTMAVRCRNYLSRRPYISAEPSFVNNQPVYSERRVIIGEENFSIYKKQREIINRKLEELEKKRLEKQKNDKSSIDIQRQWDSVRDIFKNPSDTFCHYHQWASSRLVRHFLMPWISDRMNKTVRV